MQLYIYTCRCMQNHNDDTIIDERRHFFRKICTSHFIWKGCVWEGVGDRTELQHIDLPTLMAIRISFPFSRVAQQEAWGPHSAGCWLPLLHLVSKLVWSPKTNWLPVFTKLYNSSFAHWISPHNWPSECVTSAVFGMACLIVIKRK